MSPFAVIDAAKYWVAEVDANLFRASSVAFMIVKRGSPADQHRCTSASFVVVRRLWLPWLQDILEHSQQIVSVFGLVLKYFCDAKFGLDGYVQAPDEELKVFVTGSKARISS